MTDINLAFTAEELAVHEAIRAGDAKALEKALANDVGALKTWYVFDLQRDAPCLDTALGTLARGFSDHTDFHRLDAVLGALQKLGVPLYDPNESADADAFWDLMEQLDIDVNVEDDDIEQEEIDAFVEKLVAVGAPIETPRFLQVDWEPDKLTAAIANRVRNRHRAANEDAARPSVGTRPHRSAKPL